MYLAADLMTFILAVPMIAVFLLAFFLVATGYIVVKTLLPDGVRTDGQD